jgi:16S rRNA (guanine966-N2)-methyltransferase
MARPRIVAGSAGGRPISVPPGTDVRPSSERVREAVFNALHSMELVAGASFLDLFAGSGALGLEALSRGASAATFVERRRDVARAITANLDSTGLGAAGRVVVSDGLAFAGSAAEHFDVALLDPPYEFDEWERLLAGLPAEVAVIESDRPIEPGSEWVVVRQKRYGGTVVTVARRAGAIPGVPS